MGTDAQMHTPPDSSDDEEPPVDMSTTVSTLIGSLSNLEFWTSIDWNHLHDRWSSMPTIPVEVRYSIMELRAALAQHIGNALEAQDDAKASAATKAFFMLDRLLFATAKRARGGTKGQKGESLARTICRRLRLAWSGEWGALWDEALEAVFDVGQAPARTVEEMLARDVAYVREALAEDDMRNALRRVDGLAGLAPESKARRVLPGFFPERAKALPATRDLPQPSDEDVSRFSAELDRTFSHMPTKRGPGPGGSIAEMWHWAQGLAAEWGPIRALCLRLALGRVPHEVFVHYLSARIMAADRDEPDTVQP